MRVGRYEIVGELGRGGMARVHLARQLDLDRFAALKALLALQGDDAEIAARFVRESRLAGALNHPSIVTVFDFFEHDGTPYIAMEYVRRGSLRPWVGKLSLAQIGGVLEGVLAGLDHAHGHGVIHRDLKPENLMVTDEGRVKITDFGIAKALGSGTAFRTATGATLGTPVYMAPEQAMGENVGPHTDLYATGVIAYELLSGAPPFTSHEPMAILLAHLQQEPPALPPGTAPPELAEWVHGLLAKDPAERPASARDAWDQFEEHLLEALGPRWRRSARIEGEPETPARVTPSQRPLTPAQFTGGDGDAWETVAGDEGAAPTPAPVTTPARDTAASPPSTPVRRSRTGAFIAAGVGLAALVVVGLVLALSGGDPEPVDSAAQATAEPSAAPAGGVTPLGDDWIRAVHVISYNPEGLSQPAFVDALNQAKGAGATRVVLHPILTAKSTTSAELAPKEDAPTLDDLAAGLETVKREGLAAVVQPVVEPEGNYAGAYDPDDPDAFFDAYTDHVRRIADVAGAGGAEAFVAGSLLSLLDGPDYTERWKTIIDDVRGRCNCQITYSAEDVEGAERVQFWDATDAIGVASEAALTEEPSTDVETLVAAWTPLRNRLEALNGTWDKPVLLTELGYQSKADQSAAPAYGAEGEPSEEAQAALYEAAFRAFAGTPWFVGIAWYELNGDGAEPQPDDFSFVGKQAEDVLRTWQTAGT